jgi:hypothetical protein
MTTLETLLGKCQEDADCLVWTGSLSKRSGHPKYNNKAARRVVYELAKGPIPEGRLVTTTCGCARCVNPAHLALTTKSEAAVKANACPTVRLRKAIASAKANRPNGKLDMQKASVIRDSSEGIDELAALYGVDRTLISKVRTGAAWREMKATPFQGLGAR